MSNVKTAKGTELPLRVLQGKQYLEVSYRVLWMREEHPDWGIETEYLQLSETVAIAKATIRDGAGKILAQGTKTETPKGFADFVEKAETGAVGRALALCGYGTQFAQELDEGDRVVDGPKEPRGKPALAAVPADPNDPGAYVMTFGKYNGQRLDSIGAHDLDSYVKFLKNSERKTPTGNSAIEAIDVYLKTKEVPRAK